MKKNVKSAIVLGQEELQEKHIKKKKSDFKKIIASQISELIVSEIFDYTFVHCQYHDND
jgi:hypothetical protein